MAKAYANTTLIIAAGVVIVLAAALFFLYSSPMAAVTTTTTMAATTIATTVPASTATTTVVENSSTAISPNFSACNGFNLSATGPGSTVSGQCNWAGGLLNMALYGGNFNEVGIHINQINTTVPFTANYYVSSCASNSTTQHVPVGEFNITFTTGPVAQVGIRCGNATVRLTKT